MALALFFVRLLNNPQHGLNSSLFRISVATSLGGHVTGTEMKNLYTGTFRRKETRTRDIYNRIKAMPKLGICPLCGQRVVATLDHYLPQDSHPIFAVMPVNLVASCRDCNTIKHTWQPSSANDQTLHPYFDNVDDETWLVADIEESAPPALIFSAKPPPAWDYIKQERVKTHIRG